MMPDQNRNSIGNQLPPSAAPTSVRAMTVTLASLQWAENENGHGELAPVRPARVPVAQLHVAVP
ncbi:hypothetical protein [Massilia eburnea]|uniref:hypothetical protein n=1 Tax=Massilia eburnea TaxID=1776165 RepID=UPI003D6A5E34